MATKANINNNIELLKLYYDEWKYRLDNFRKQLLQASIVIFFTSSLPITINLFNDVKIPRMPLILFPIAGIGLTIIFMAYCLAEASRINTLDSQIKLIIKENFSSQYHKNSLIPVISNKPLKFLCKKMTIWIPIALACFEIIIAIFMILLIYNDAIL